MEAYRKLRESFQAEFCGLKDCRGDICMKSAGKKMHG